MSRLLTDNAHAQLLENGIAKARCESRDPMPVVKLFTPDAHATWLLTELDPRDQDTAFGLCDLGMCAPFMGHVRLSDLERIRGPNDLAIVRDLYFTPKWRISEYFQRAQTDGSIND